MSSLMRRHSPSFCCRRLRMTGMATPGFCCSSLTIWAPFSPAGRQPQFWQGCHWVLLLQLDASRYPAGCRQEAPCWQVLAAGHKLVPLASTEHKPPQQCQPQKQVQQCPASRRIVQLHSDQAASRRPAIDCSWLQAWPLPSGCSTGQPIAHCAAASIDALHGMQLLCKKRSQNCPHPSCTAVPRLHGTESHSQGHLHSRGPYRHPYSNMAHIPHPP